MPSSPVPEMISAGLETSSGVRPHELCHPLPFMASKGLDCACKARLGMLHAPLSWLASSGLVRLWGTRLGTLGSPPLQMASTGKDKPWDARTGMLCSPLPFHNGSPQGHAGQGSLTSIFHGWYLQVQTGLGEPVRGSRNTPPMDHLWKAGQALGSKAEVAVPPLPCLA